MIRTYPQVSSALLPGSLPPQGDSGLDYLMALERRGGIDPLESANTTPDDTGAEDVGYVTPKSTRAFQQVGIPIMALAETLSSRGKSPGTAALASGQQLRALEQDRMKQARDLSKTGYDRERQAKLDALQRRVSEASIEASEAGLGEKKMALKRRADFDALIEEGIPQNEAWERIYGVESAKQKAEVDLWKQKENWKSQAEAIKNARELQEQKDKEKRSKEEKLSDRPLPALQATNLGMTLSGINELDKMVKSMGDIELSGPIFGRIRQINPWDTTGQAVKALQVATKQIIGKGLEGGVLRKEDENKYEAIIPKMNDTKEALAQKYAQLRSMLKAKYNYDIDALKNAGFALDKFGPVPDYVPPGESAPAEKPIDQLKAKAKAGDEKAQQYLTSKGETW